MAGLNTVAVRAQLESHALALGVFDRVNLVEPKAAQAKGFNCSIYVASIDPARLKSGLAATTARVEWVARIQRNMLSEPAGDIDLHIMIAADLLFTRLAADFTLGGTVRNIDLLAEAGEPLRARAGYVPQDNVMFRIMDVFIPVIINDAWNQEA